MLDANLHEILKSFTNSEDKVDAEQTIKDIEIKRQIKELSQEVNEVNKKCNTELITVQTFE